MKKASTDLQQLMFGSESDGIRAARAPCPAAHRSRNHSNISPHACFGNSSSSAQDLTLSPLVADH
jgi:hypothetical protein